MSGRVAEGGQERCGRRLGQFPDVGGGQVQRRWRTEARTSAKAGTVLACQAAWRGRRERAQRRWWATRRSQLKRPSRTGVVRAMAAGFQSGSVQSRAARGVRGRGAGGRDCAQRRRGCASGSVGQGATGQWLPSPPIILGVVKIRSRVNVRPFDPVREGPPTAASKADPVREGPRWIRAQP